VWLGSGGIESEIVVGMMMNGVERFPGSPIAGGSRL